MVDGSGTQEKHKKCFCVLLNTYQVYRNKMSFSILWPVKGQLNNVLAQCALFSNTKTDEDKF